MGPRWSPRPARCCTRPADRPGRSQRTAPVAAGSLAPPPLRGALLVSELGPNAFGKHLDPGRVGDCYLALPLPDEDGDGPGGVLVVAPRWLLHPAVPQPAGSLVYELVTGHPDRGPGELVFPADLD